MRIPYKIAPFLTERLLQYKILNILPQIKQFIALFNSSWMLGFSNRFVVFCIVLFFTMQRPKIFCNLLVAVEDFIYLLWLFLIEFQKTI
jgi:hypothetical protein